MVWKPHATVAAVIERDDTFLMVEELIDGETVINQPAGHLDDDESLIEAVIREVQEETAWTFKPAGVLGIYRWRHPTKGHTHMRTTFFGEATDHNPNQPLDSPIIKAQWYTLDQLRNNEKLRSPMVLRCIDDYLNGQRHPLALLHDV